MRQLLDWKPLQASSAAVLFRASDRGMGEYRLVSIPAALWPLIEIPLAFHDKQGSQHASPDQDDDEENHCPVVWGYLLLAILQTFDRVCNATQVRFRYICRVYPYVDLVADLIYILNGNPVPRRPIANPSWDRGLRGHQIPQSCKNQSMLLRVDQAGNQATRQTLLEAGNASDSGSCCFLTCASSSTIPSSIPVSELIIYRPMAPGGQYCSTESHA